MDERNVQHGAEIELRDEYWVWVDDRIFDWGGDTVGRHNEHSSDCLLAEGCEGEWHYDFPL